MVIPNFGTYLTIVSQILMCSEDAKQQSNMFYV